jgi:primosomal protein N' (replication factor Y)
LIPSQCKHCNSDKLYLSGTGTQKAEEILSNTFSNSKIVRLDTDAIRSGKHLTQTLQDFNNGKIEILLGTQMIAKGLDFGNVTLVGIINADTGLFLPDFRSGEKVFQLIYQAAGRAGRRKIKGEVVIQSFNADNSVIRYAAKLDLKKYYNIIIDERKELDYPPFNWLAKAVFTGKDRRIVEETTQQVRKRFSHDNKSIEILGPAWCYREKLRNKYRMQIVFKSSKEADPNGAILHKYISNNLVSQKYPSNIRLNLDIDPISLL